MSRVAGGGAHPLNGASGNVNRRGVAGGGVANDLVEADRRRRLRASVAIARA